MISLETTKLASTRRERPCTEQIATLRVIVEQSIEWNSSLYVNFVDLEKACDSLLHRESFWELMRHYAIPEKSVTLIRNIYEHIIIIRPLFTLGSVYSKSASGAEQTTETNNSN